MGLFSRKKSENKNIEPSFSIDTSTYFAEAKQASKANNGHQIYLKALLKQNRAKFVKEVKDNKVEQEKLKQSHVIEKNKLVADLKRINTFLELKQPDITECNNEIDNCNEEIRDAKENPGKYNIDPKTNLSPLFYFGSFILLLVTYYLIVFYISTAYSTFFRNFGYDTTVVEAMFDTQAISKAWADGGIALSVILSFPFIFLALGFLMHIFKSNLKKLIPTFIIAFIFDIILAYKIEYKIYEVSKTFNSPDHNLSIALQSFDFWIIIFSGFIIYLIWGSIFDYLAQQYEDSNEYRIFKNSRNEKIDELKDKREKLGEQIMSERDLKPEIEKQIKLKEDILAQRFIVPEGIYDTIHTQTFNGWLSGITNVVMDLGWPLDKKDALLEECERTSDNFLKGL
ncbi:MAG: hypothetical protein H8E55_20635 [Pelagibacterales bacterium]|nr:hypothetical protein [Pelagibacterales bacterium]